MALLGISLIAACVVWFVVRPPIRLPPWLSRRWLGASDESQTQQKDEQSPARRTTKTSREKKLRDSEELNTGSGRAPAKAPVSDRAAMPPPPLPPTIQPPTFEVTEDASEEQTTPKASASQLSDPVPSLVLPNGVLKSDKPASSGPRNFAMPPPPVPLRASSATSRSSSTPRIPVLQQFPAANSPQRASGPIPKRSGAPSSGLAPPPTHSAVPTKPKRKVLLSPGHSPLDWARLSGPNADLRGVPPSMPYVKVTPSMLRQQTGRKGKDAWTALNGRVYNISPYLDFHPGGGPELMRAAGRDGTRLFGEIHPWVNYETMLSACLIGLLVEEPAPGTSVENEMERMD